MRKKKFAINFGRKYLFMFWTEQSYDEHKVCQFRRNLFNSRYTNSKLHIEMKTIERTHQIKKKKFEWIYLLHYHIVYFMRNVPPWYVIPIFTEKKNPKLIILCKQTLLWDRYGKIEYVSTYPRYHSSCSSLAESINSFFYHKDESEPYIRYKRALKTNSFF